MGEENKATQAPATETAPSPAAPAPVSGGGKSNNKVVIIILIVVVVLGIIGYAAQKYFAKRIAEKSAESIIGGLTGSDVDINSGEDGGVSINSNGNSLSSGSQAKWPSTMPSSVPEFKYGTISYSSTTADDAYKGWSASFTGVEAPDLTAYGNQLTALGWAEIDRVESNIATNITYEKDEYRINLTYDPNSKDLSLSAYNK